MPPFRPSASSVCSCENCPFVIRASSPFSPSPRLPPASDVCSAARRVFAGLCSLCYLLFNCPHSAFRLRTEPRTLNPHEGTLPRSLHFFTRPKNPLFSRGISHPVPRQGTYASQHTSLYLRPQTQKHAFSAGNTHFPNPQPPAPSLQRGTYSPIAPMVLTPKNPVFPEKYAHHLNSVLRGCLHLQKMPCFPDPFACKTALEAKKSFTCPHRPPNASGDTPQPSSGFWPANPTLSVDVLAELLPLGIVERKRVGNLTDAGADEWRCVPAPPTSLGAMKTCTSSIAQVKQRAQQLGAAFDKQVGHAAAAELIEQLDQAVVLGGGVERKDLAAGGGQSVAIRFGRRCGAGRYEHGRLACGADELAIEAERGAVIDDDSRGDALARRARGQQGVVSPCGAAADEDCIDASAKLMYDRCAIRHRRSTCCRRRRWPCGRRASSPTWR